MHNKLLIAITSCALIMGLSACLSNETASTSNNSKAKAEEKAQKETEQAQKAEEKAKQEEQQRQEAEVQKQAEEKAKQEAEVQKQAEEKAKQEQAEREEQQRQVEEKAKQEEQQRQAQEQARKQQAAQAQKQREVKKQKKEEPEICGSPEVGITCEHLQKEWENEQKLPKPKYTINGTTGQIFDENGNEIIDETKLPDNPTEEELAKHHKELHNRPPGWTWEGKERGE
ncbi:hypothetical protein RAC77_07015 [Bacillus sp. BR_7]|uniref:hypothetical protein n=1 Tax=Bacillus TaxID=1386 RepID=UPI0022E10479|nr:MULTISPECIES: hypothetical protein [unclassified Bacillus cereus group]MDA1581589.1 hypothetical protein [Bacillus cereus group sp. TH228LC]MDA1834514.1 hypothetical protein [Bacillus cereus group sp. BY142LC]